jgi:hypothetical protein
MAPRSRTVCRALVSATFGHTMKIPLLSIGLGLPRQVAAKLITLAFITFVTGCAFPTYKAYDGLERPKSEIVAVQNSSRSAFWSFTDIYSVDHLRINQPASEIAILPGAHWHQVVVTRRSKAAMVFLKDGFYQEAICGFMLDAAPGAAYTLGSVDSGGLVSTNEHKVYNASLEIEERFANGAPATRHIPIECASLDLIKHGWLERLEPIVSKGFLCRAKADCLAEGFGCIKEAGKSHGICSKP